jgi:hypothetical protein
MQVKGRKTNTKINSNVTENRGFNSALYFNAPKKLEIETRDCKLEKRRKIGKEAEATPKSIDTPQSCTSINLKRCIPNDLFNKIEESSPIKSHGSREDYEIIAPDFDNFDESSDNIIINLKPLDIEIIPEESHLDNAQTSMNFPNSQSYFYRADNNNFNNFNQYNSHPNLIGYPMNNTMQLNPTFYFRSNNSEGNLLNNGMNNNNNNNNNSNNNNETQQFNQLFKINDFKNEETATPSTIKETKANKNITKKTINNQDIKGWTCTQCKNFNYESKNYFFNFK